jgi:hypothetical protein
MSITFDCPICFDALGVEEEDDVVTTPCGHVFHRKCITCWLQREGGRQTCPSCVRKVTRNKLLPVFLSSIQNVRPDSDRPSALVSFLDESAARDSQNITSQKDKTSMNCAEFRAYHANLSYVVRTSSRASLFCLILKQLMCNVQRVYLDFIEYRKEFEQLQVIKAAQDNELDLVRAQTLSLEEMKKKLEE